MPSSRMLALLGLLAVAGYQHRDRLGELLRGVTDGSADGRPDRNLEGGPADASGGMGGILGGLFGGGNGGNDLRGGLADLIENFSGAGQRETAQSWVSPGPNRQLDASELAAALGDDTIRSLSAQTGLSKEELLSRLQSVLPDAVDKMTPEGRVPIESAA